MNRKLQHYNDQVVSTLQTEFGKKNRMAVAKLDKITINVGIGREQVNREKVVEAVTEQLGRITGQRPHVCPARISIATFKIRAGDPVGVAVTLRGQRMWDFYDKLVSIVLPQVKDFRGVPRTAFDQAGNYSLGLKEQIVFPEIAYDDIDRVRGMQIVMTIENSAGAAESTRMLELLGMPFTKTE